MAKQSTENRPGYYSTSAAARLLGVSGTHVRWLLQRGLLRGMKTVDGAMWLVDGECLWRLKAEREKNPPRRGRKRRESTRV